MYLLNPSATTGKWYKMVFTHSKAYLNSEFSFSSTSYFIKMRKPSLHYYLRGTFNKFPDFFVQAFKIVVDSWKFSILLLYILWDHWPIFMISASNQQLQQQLEYTLLKPDCHSWWISKMQSDTLEVLNLEKMPQKFYQQVGGECMMTTTNRMQRKQNTLGVKYGNWKYITKSP